MPYRDTMNASTVRLAWMVSIATAVLIVQSCGGDHDSETAESEPGFDRGEVVQPVEDFYLTRVRIPPASRHRDSDDSPDLYVVLHEDGTEVAESTVQCGWEVEFPKEEQNRFRVKPGSSYVLDLRDHDYLSSDDRIVQVVELSSESFKRRILESLGQHDSSDRAVTFDFKPADAKQKQE